MEYGTAVELHVTDFRSVKDYYHRLGFETVWERQPDRDKGYMVLRLGRNILCFWPGNEYMSEGYFGRFPADTLRGYGVELILTISGITEYYNRVKADANVVSELAVKPWGVKDFRAVDPNGYYLRFTEPYDMLDASYAAENQ